MLDSQSNRPEKLPNENEAQFFTAANFTMRSERCTLTPHVRQSKTVLNSGFHEVDSRFQVLESLMGFRIP